MAPTTERQQFEQWWETAMHNGYPPRFGWEHWRDGDGYRDDDGEFQGLWLAWLASRKLANREAQPVAYMYKDNIHADARFSLYKRFGNWSQEDINEYEITEIPLYTAPPAPAVQDDLIMQVRRLVRALKKSNPDHVLVKQVPDYMRRAGYWKLTDCLRDDDDCRAAMLAQPVSGGYTLPDGWKLVPIDATRAMIDAAQRVEEDGYDAMHKAMLAAAPEAAK